VEGELREKARWERVIPQVEAGAGWKKRGADLRGLGFRMD
jgi:hypothetical protein